MGLHDEIRAEVLNGASKSKKEGKEAKKSKKAVDGLSTSPMVLAIEQALNKLFYLPPKYDEELEMLKYQYAQEGTERYGLHASAILAPDSEFCYREQVLSLFYRQIQGENIPIGRKRIYEEGKSIGTKWQRLFIRGGIAKKEDLDVSRFVKKYDLSYTPDAKILLFKNKPFIVEIKSQNTFQFKNSKSHPSGVKQLKFYMYMEGVEQGFVLVEDKNDQNFKILLVDNLDVTELEPYIERLETIQVYKRQFLEEKKMVERHPRCTSSTCKMASECNMRDACWNVGMGRVKLERRP